MAEWDFDDRRVWRYSTGGRPVELARQMLSLLSAEQPAPEDLTTLSAIVTHASLTNLENGARLQTRPSQIQPNACRWPAVLLEPRHATTVRLSPTISLMWSARLGHADAMTSAISNPPSAARSQPVLPGSTDRDCTRSTYSSWGNVRGSPNRGTRLRSPNHVMAEIESSVRVRIISPYARVIGACASGR